MCVCVCVCVYARARKYLQVGHENRSRGKAAATEHPVSGKLLARE